MIRRISLGENALSYEDVVNRWRKANVDKSTIFSGDFLIYLTTSISRIEGLDVSIHTTRELFQTETVSNYNGDIRALYSLLNSRKLADVCCTLLQSEQPISVDMIKEFHRILMFGSIDRHSYNDNGERAGQFKKKDYCVGRYFVGYPPEEVESGLLELLEILDSNSGADVLKVATAFHCWFEHIHPFADGNGRVGRWLLNYYLVLNDHPPIILEDELRSDYYDALESFDRSENLDAMYGLLRNATVLTYPAIRYML